MNTSRRRDILAEIVDDSPDTAEKLLLVFVDTDQRTPEGCAARDDTLRFLFSLTTGAKELLDNKIAEFIQNRAASIVAVFVTCTLYLIS